MQPEAENPYLHQSTVRSTAVFRMNELVELAAARGVEQIVGEYRRTDRNGLIADFFDKMGFHLLPDSGEREGTRLYRLTVADFEPFASAIDVTQGAGAG